LNRKIGTGFVLAFAATISMAALSSAQPWDGGPHPYPDHDPWPLPWAGQDDRQSEWDYTWSYRWGDGWTYGWEYGWLSPLEEARPITEPTPEQFTFRDGTPTTTRPEGREPSSTPSASTGSSIPYLEDGAGLSELEVSRLPGGSSLMAPGGLAAPPGSVAGSPVAFQSYYGGTQPYQRYRGGLQQWIYYCGRWTYGPGSLIYGQQTNTIIRNDQYQMLWSYERYPSGYESWQFWGYWYPGYRHAWFGADAQGWHQIAVWGSRSGWSNPIWVYVW